MNDTMKLRDGRERRGSMMQTTLFRYVQYLTLWAVLFPVISVAQSNTKGPSDFPELVITNITGAAKLSKPTLIVGSKAPVLSEGFGIAAPAFWDLDGDGLRDLLIGEFGSGAEYGHSVGSFLRVYRNNGTEVMPEFDGRFDYARPPFRFFGNGTPYSVEESCCMGFTPQFVDLNADGYQDLITGQYQGEVTWFPGSEEGFLQGELLKQEGNPRDPDNKNFVRNQSYWLYSTASFGDFTGDGLPDMILGGKSLRISRNTGTASLPTFAKREFLLDVNGDPLRVYEYTADELKIEQEQEELSRGINKVPEAGDGYLSPFVVDWDNDGVLDLLVTNSYAHRQLPVVSFFKGIKVNNIHRFQKATPLFLSKDGEKEFPGNAPRISVADWNNDGIKDLLIGISVITMRNEFNANFSWNWESEWGIIGVSKYPMAYMSHSENELAAVKRHTKLPSNLSWEDYLAIRHQGYIYVMLGIKEEVQPVVMDKKIKNRKAKK